jgi:hypothetical protein
MSSASFLNKWGLRDVTSRSQRIVRAVQFIFLILKAVFKKSVTVYFSWIFPHKNAFRLGPVPEQQVLTLTGTLFWNVPPCIRQILVFINVSEEHAGSILYLEDGG